jgi:hypothetical protein
MSHEMAWRITGPPPHGILPLPISSRMGGVGGEDGKKKRVEEQKRDEKHVLRFARDDTVFR